MSARSVVRGAGGTFGARVASAAIVALIVLTILWQLVQTKELEMSQRDGLYAHTTGTPHGARRMNALKEELLLAQSGHATTTPTIPQDQESQPSSPPPPTSPVAELSVQTVAARVERRGTPTLLLLSALYAGIPPPLVLPASANPSNVGTPSPAMLHWLTRNVVVGVMGFSRGRVEAIEGSWGRYLKRGSIFFYTDDPWPDNPAVVNLPHPRPGVEVTDRRGSAWKILPAVRHMYEHAPADARWFYLCDDDSYPLVHMLAALASEYDATSEIYAGESTGQNAYMKAYYKDEEDSGQVGRHLQLRYQCTGGGVLFSRALLERLVPVLQRCPVFFASDVSLGYCVHEFAGVKEVTKITSVHHAYPRTPEEIQKKYSYDEPLLTQALAFHHMKPYFIYEDGVPKTDSPEQYLADTEARMFPAWIHTLGVLRLKTLHDPEYARAQEWPGLQPGAILKASALPVRPASVGPLRLLRVALVHVGGTDDLRGNVAEKVHALSLSETFPFGLGFLAPHMFQPDIIYASVEGEGCHACSGYSVKPAQAQCARSARFTVHELFNRPPAQLHPPSAVDSALLGRAVSIDQVDWTAYDLVVSSDMLVPSSIRAAAKWSTVFLHSGSKACELSGRPRGGVRNETPSLRLSSAASDGSIVFPSSALLFSFYGLLHLLRRSPSEPYGAELHARNVLTDLLVDVALDRLTGRTELEASVAGVVASSAGRNTRADLVASFSHARLCLFTPGLTEFPEIGDVDPVRDSIVLAIMSGCHALFSTALAARVPELRLLVTHELAGVPAVVSLLPALLRNAAQPFLQRVGVIEAGRQRMALNRYMMDEPLDRLLRAAGAQLQAQRAN